MREKLLAIGVLTHPMTTPEFAAFLKAEDQRWGKVIAQSGIKPD